ncbi:putative pre-mRNA-splicing factor ATP-dependent RNA helicase DHX16 [Porphyridium purpureum]|uniref:RNA helicase n=1 Tax=Porphyridium purpureum TaxID=35688 RepID=A0A5J4Z1S2_PORPP|nr:putative pre-mRNA-splicing factor ATP-dependent RNA helicase DHX16 [Porphyridium purpureum]|eukprot:POR5121..scf208_2
MQDSSIDAPPGKRARTGHAETARTPTDKEPPVATTSASASSLRDVQYGTKKDYGFVHEVVRQGVSGMNVPSVLPSAKPQETLQERKGLSQNDAALAFDVKSELDQIPGCQDGTLFSEQSAQRTALLSDAASLPIAAYRSELMSLIEANPVVIVVGETGSGKSTQIPQFLLDSGRYKRVAVTQPRRVAAMSLAARVALERGVRLGAEVGFAVRFESKCRADTCLKFMTDGVLFREIVGDAELGAYDVVIVDEAHERSLATDLLLALIKDLVKFRWDARRNGESRATKLRLVVSSATLNAELFQRYFDNAPLVQIPGRRFPVDVLYAKEPQPDYVAAAVRTALHIHASMPLPGDVLIFLSGQNEIEAAAAELKEVQRAAGTALREMIITPVYSALPSEQQALIFARTPPNARKIVIATNIAETSVTIDGIVYVIDCGLTKVKTFQPKTRVESLQVAVASQAAATQRAGRAGRTQAGVCFRLYTKWSFENEMPPQSLSEMSRSELSAMVLMLKTLGIDDLVHFDFLEPPPTDALVAALELLFSLRALNATGELTEKGTKLAELPIDVRLGSAVLASDRLGCSLDMCKLAAVLTVSSSGSSGSGTFFVVPHRDSDAEQGRKKMAVASSMKRAFEAGGRIGFGGDPIALLNVYSQWEASGYSSQWCFDHFVHARSLRRARDVFKQLHEIVSKKLQIQSETGIESNSPPSSVVLRKALCCGYFPHACRLQRNGEYQTLGGAKRTVHIHPSSALYKAEQPPTWICYYELLHTTKLFVRGVFQVEVKWLQTVAPHVFAEALMQDTPKRHLSSRP